MKTKKTVMRTCVVTRDKFPKNELLRIVRTKDGQVMVDLTGKMNGRGAYIKKDLAVLEQAIKKNILASQLEVDISDDVYETIKETINKQL